MPFSCARCLCASALVISCLFLPPRPVAARSDPLKPSRACRATIGRLATKLFGTALAILDACHAARDRGKPVGDCNVLASADPDGRLLALEASIESTLKRKCVVTDPVRSNYPSGDIGLALRNALVDVEASGAEIQGAPDIVGNRGLVKCHGTLGRARTRLVVDGVRVAVRCQGEVDKSATTFGALLADCRVPEAESADKAQRSIAAACVGVDGSDVGNSCGSLSADVVQVAMSTGATLGEAVFGGPQSVASAEAGSRFSFGSLVKFVTGAFRSDGKSGSYHSGGRPFGGQRFGFSSLFGSIRKTARPGGGNTFTIRYSPLRTKVADRQLTVRAEADAPRLLVALRKDACTLSDDFIEVPLDPGSTETEFDVDFPDTLGAGDFGLAFAVDDGNGVEAFTTVAQTEAGGPLRLVKDINPGPASSSPFLFNEFLDQSLNGVLFFSADDGHVGSELWRTDGTANGTFLLADLNPGPDGSFADEFTHFGDRVFFVSSSIDGLGSCELWQTDGTTAGTSKVFAAADLDPDASCFSDLQAFAGMLYFTLSLPDQPDRPLWRTDGTLAGTAPFASVTIEDSAGGRSEGIFAQLGNVLFFSATDRAHGSELWRTDGTEAGTFRVVDLNHGRDGSHPFGLVALNGRLYFRATDGKTGKEPWVSDGTPEGTILLADTAPGKADGFAFDFTAVKQRVFFNTFDSGAFDNPNAGVWITDGTPAGTRFVKRLAVQPFDTVAVNDVILFTADDGTTGLELWRSDGTPEGTVLVKDLVPGAEGGSPFPSAVIGGTYFFTAFDARGGELWQSDGTEAGTGRVRDLFPGPEGGGSGFGVKVDQRLFFTADDGEHGFELWVISP